MKIIFATHNQHKLEEVRAILQQATQAIGGEPLEVYGLDEIGCHEEIPETGDTLQQNALQKATYVSEHYGCSCFADDTGLEIDALGGRPGVYSARYAGEPSDSAANRSKVLDELKGESNRQARFRTVIAFIHQNENYFFEGQVEGEMTREECGEKGFGYDAIFRPIGYEQTFAQLPSEVKNAISHRGMAMRKFIDFLINLPK